MRWAPGLWRGWSSFQLLFSRAKPRRKIRPWWQRLRLQIEPLEQRYMLNAAPVATDDPFAVRKDEVLEIGAPGILAYDTDEDNDPLTAVLVTGPTHGSVSLAADGSFAYTPDAGYAGTDSFVYLANDGALDSNPATVSIVVNTPPSTVADAYIGSPGVPLEIATGGVLANDTDADGNPLTAELIDGLEGLVFQSNGTFVFTPSASLNSVATFTYRARDPYHPGTIQTVSLDFNNPLPVAGTDSYSTGYGGTIVIDPSELLANDSDPDSTNPLTFVGIGGNTGNADAHIRWDGKIVVSAVNSGAGGGAFNYSIKDYRGGTSEGTVNVSFAENQAPTAPTQTGREVHDRPIDIDLAGGVTDPEGQSLSFSTPDGALYSGSIFRFTPPVGFVGTQTLTYTVTDSVGATSTGSVVIEYTNQVPKVSNHAIYVLPGVGYSGPAGALLAGAADADGDSLAVIPGGNLNADGSFSYYSNNVGYDQFTYSVTDGAASTTGTVNVTVNNAPEVAAGATLPTVTVSEIANELSSAGVLVSYFTQAMNNGTPVASDVNGHALGIAVIGQNNTHGTWQFSTNGSAWTDVGLVDDSIQSLLLADDGVTRIRFIPNSTVEGDITQALVVRIWDGMEGVNGQMTAAVGDRTGGARAFSQGTLSVNINVDRTNDAPSISLPSAASGRQDEPLVFAAAQNLGIDVADPDAADNPLVMTISADRGTLSAAAGATLSGSNTATLTLTGSLADLRQSLAALTFVPPANYRGAVSLSFTLNDQGNTGSGGPQSTQQTLPVQIGVPFSVVGTQLYVTGTVGDDQLSLIYNSADEFVVTINGVSATYNVAQVQAIQVAGEGGDDYLYVSQTAVSNAVTVSSNGVTATIGNQSLAVSGVNRLLFQGHTGDQALFEDLPSTETLFFLAANATQSSSAVSYDGTRHYHAAGFTNVSATRSPGSQDVAIFADSPSADALAMSPTLTTLTGPGYTFAAAGFEQVYAYRTYGGADTATFTDSDGQETFYGLKPYVAMTGAGFLNEAIGFTSVTAQSSNHSDTAVFWDSSDDDTWSVTATAATLSSANYSVTAIGFHTVNALAQGGGQDTANLSNPSTASQLYVRPRRTSWTSSDGTLAWYAEGFEQVAVVGSGSASIVGWQNNTLSTTAGGHQLSGEGFQVQVSGYSLAAGSMIAGNVAPTLSTTAAAPQYRLNEATVVDGLSIAELLNSSTNLIADSTDSLTGVAVVNTQNSGGTWEYRATASQSWQSLTGASDTAARLLAADGSARVRFVPSNTFSTASQPALTFRAWDRTAGVNGGTLNVSTANLTAVSTHSRTIAFVRNVAPTFVSTPTLAPITEDDTNNLGISVSSLVGSHVSDGNDDKPLGLAITGTGGIQGTWQYSFTAGTRWSAVGTASTTNAFLLSAQPNTRLRFVPNANVTGQATLTVVAWDGTRGQSGGRADVSTRGGFTPFSQATKTVTQTVVAVNDAPQVDTSLTPRLNASTSTTDSSTLVSDLIQRSGGNDVDSTGLGIAVTHVDSTYGTWEYSPDGTTWSPLYSPNSWQARLLPGSAQVRMTPSQSTFTQLHIPQALRFRVWDGTQGTAWQTADVGIGGGSQAFSLDSATASLAINNSPDLDPSTIVLTSLTEATRTENAGYLLSELVGEQVMDADGVAELGVAIVGTTVPSDTGYWQYRLNDSAPWQHIEPTSVAAALLLPLDDQARLRFVATSTFSTSDRAYLNFVAWDRSQGTAGQRLKAVDRGDGSPFSDSIGLMKIQLNDAPVLGSDAVSFPSMSQAPTYQLAGVSVADLIASVTQDLITDVNGDSEGLAITGLTDTWTDAAGEVVSSGVWQFSTNEGETWHPFGAVSTTEARLLADDSQTRIRFVPALGFAGDVTLEFYAWDGTRGSPGAITDLGEWHVSSPFSQQARQASLTVNANQSPVFVSESDIQLGDLEEDTVDDGVTILSLTTDTISDPDPGAWSGVALSGYATSAAGQWQYRILSQGWYAWQDLPPLTTGEVFLMPSSNVLSIRFAPAENYFGPAGSLTVQAWDRTSATDSFGVFDTSELGSSLSVATRQIQQTITPVNDEPSFQWNEFGVLEDSGAYVSENFASFSVGPPNEADQTLSWTVIATEPALFSEQPTIDEHGTLRFTPAPDMYTDLTDVSVVLTESDAEGNVLGTYYSGFSFGITAVNDAPVANAPEQLSIPAAHARNYRLTGIQPDAAGFESQTLSVSIAPAETGMEGNWEQLLVSYASPANFANLTLVPAAGFVGQTAVRITITDNGGTNDSGVDSVSYVVPVTVDPTPPLGTSPAVRAYTEGDPALSLIDDLVISFPNDTELNSAAVSLTTGYASSEDSLSFDLTLLPPEITAAFDPNTGVLSLVGTAPIATYQGILRSVSYVNSSVHPAETQRTIAVSATAESMSSSITRQLDVTDIDGVTVGVPMTSISPVGQYVPVTIGGEFELTAGTVVTAIVDWGDGNTSPLNLTETSYAAGHTYTTSGNFTISVMVTTTTSAETQSLDISVNAAALALASRTTIRSYTESDPALALVDDLLITFPVETDIQSASVQLKTGYASAEDSLSIDPDIVPPEITATYDVTTGTLSLVGVASLATYESVLRGVTYQNSSPHPSETRRSFDVSATANSQTTTLTRYIDVTDLDGLTIGEPTGSASPEEHRPFTISGTVDISFGAITGGTIDWGDGSSSALNVSDTSYNAEHIYVTRGNYSISLTVTSTSSQKSENLDITVADVAPVVSNLALTPSTITEGGSTTLTGQVDLPDFNKDENFDIKILWGDGSIATTIAKSNMTPFGTLGTTWTFSHVHVYANNPNSGTAYTITVTASDEEGEKSPQSVDITVSNAAPTITSATATIDETGAAVLTLIASDPADPLSYDVTWGDFTPNSSGSMTNAPLGGNVWNAAPGHTFTGAPGTSYTITGNVTDSDGGSAPFSVTVTIPIPPPAIAITSFTLATPTVNEGSGATATVVYIDGTPTVTGSVSWSTFVASSLLPADSFTFYHTFTDDPTGDDNDVELTATVGDSIGGEATMGAEITVNNVAPTVTLSGGEDADEDSGAEDVTIRGTIDDPGTADTFTIVVKLNGEVLTTIENGTSRTFWFTIPVDDDDLPEDGDEDDGGTGTRDIEVTVTDDDGGEDTASLSFNVENVDPEGPDEPVEDPSEYKRYNETGCDCSDECDCDCEAPQITCRQRQALSAQRLPQCPTQGATT